MSRIPTIMSNNWIQTFQDYIVRMTDKIINIRLFRFLWTIYCCIYICIYTVGDLTGESGDLACQYWGQQQSQKDPGDFPLIIDMCLVSHKKYFIRLWTHLYFYYMDWTTIFLGHHTNTRLSCVLEKLPPFIQERLM